MSAGHWSWSEVTVRSFNASFIESEKNGIPVIATDGVGCGPLSHSRAMLLADSF